jgi:hypothetical protein
MILRPFSVLQRMKIGRMFGETGIIGELRAMQFAAACSYISLTCSRRPESANAHYS